MRSNISVINTSSVTTRKKVLTASIGLALASNALADTQALKPDAPDAANPLLQPAEQLVQELLIIDTRVENYQQMILRRRRHLTPIVVRPEEDGLEVLTRALSRFPNVTALHLVSHGEAGKLLLGKSWIDEQMLERKADALHTLLRQTTAQRPDILLYGCDVAATQQGKSFVKRLSQLTGFDVAASNDITGESALGGNWTLETTTGQIEASLAWAQSDLPVMTGTLATFTVTTLADSGLGSLRQAILDANAAVGSDNVNISATGTITLYTGELAITDNVYIEGPGSDNLTISGNNNSRVLHIDSGLTVAVSGVTITAGSATGDGGGILVDDPVVVPLASQQSSSISDDLAIDNRAPAYNGYLIVVDSVITGNNADGNGGGISSNVNTYILANANINNNYAYLSGGGIAVTAGLRAYNATVRDNFSWSGAGGISSNTSLSLFGSSVSGNTTAYGEGGGIQAKNAYLSQAVISGNTVWYGSGGGLNSFSAYIETSTISHNRASGYYGGNQGGGINSAVLNINSSTISGNRVSGDGGGISTYGSLEMQGSTVNNNTAKAAGYVSPVAGNAGGIFIGGSGINHIENSTVSGNLAESPAAPPALSGGAKAPILPKSAGGGIFIDEAATLDLSFTTVTGNEAGLGGGIREGYSYTEGVFTTGNLNSSHAVIAENTAQFYAPDLFSYSTDTTVNFSLIGDTVGANFTGSDNILDINPQLGVLADNGGATQTHMPDVFNSPVIDMGDSAIVSPPTSDQRGNGYHRVVGDPYNPPAIVDMGAVEVTNCIGGDMLVPTAALGFGVKRRCHASVALEVENGSILEGNAVVAFYAPMHSIASGSTFSVALGSTISFSPPVFFP